MQVENTSESIAAARRNLRQSRRARSLFTRRPTIAHTSGRVSFANFTRDRWKDAIGRLGSREASARLLSSFVSVARTCRAFGPSQTYVCDARYARQMEAPHWTISTGHATANARTHALTTLSYVPHIKCNRLLRKIPRLIIIDGVQIATGDKYVICQQSKRSGRRFLEQQIIALTNASRSLVGSEFVLCLVTSV